MYRYACEMPGSENATTVIACIFARGVHIHSADSYLRSRIRTGERRVCDCSDGLDARYG
nr:replication initiation protein RepC [Pararhizobium polonicum]